MGDSFSTRASTTLPLLIDLNLAVFGDKALNLGKLEEDVLFENYSTSISANQYTYYR